MYVMIAKFVDVQNKNYTKVTGFRLMDTETYGVFDVSTKEAENMQISNLNLKDGKWFCGPTSLALYPTVGIDSKTKNNLTLVKAIFGSTYWVADREGNCRVLGHGSFMQCLKIQNAVCNVNREMITELLYNSVN